MRSVHAARIGLGVLWASALAAAPMAAAQDTRPAEAPEVKALAPLLASDDFAVRLAAVQGLAKLKTPDACRLLARLLGDEVEPVRRLATDAIRAAGADADAALVEVMRTGGLYARLGAIPLLRAADDPAAAEALATAAGDDDRLVRLAALRHVRAVFPVPVAALKQAWADADPTLRAAALAALPLGRAAAADLFLQARGAVLDRLDELIKAARASQDEPAEDRAANISRQMARLVETLARTRRGEFEDRINDPRGGVTVRVDARRKELHGHFRTLTGTISRCLDAERAGKVTAALAAMDQAVGKAEAALSPVLVTRDRGGVRAPREPTEALLAALQPARDAVSDAAAAIDEIMQRDRQWALRVLIDALADAEAGIRQEAERLLAGHVADAGELLIEAAADPRAPVRIAVVPHLGRLATGGAVEALKKCLADTDWRVRRSAVVGLTGVQVRIIEPVVPLLKDERVEIRRAAAEAMCAYPDAAFVPAARAAIGDADAWVRLLAVGILDGAPSQASRDALAAALTDSDERVRLHAAWSLAGHRDPRAVPALLRLLAEDGPQNIEREPDPVPADVAKAVEARRILPRRPDVRKPIPWRREAAKALGRIGDPRGCQPLIDAAADPDPDVRRAALVALTKRKDVPETVFEAAWLAEPFDPAQLSPAQWRRLQPQHGTDRLIQLLSARNLQDRVLAAEQLADRGEARAIRPLVEALGAAELRDQYAQTVRRAMAAAAVRLCRSAASPEQALRGVRISAAAHADVLRELARIGPPAVELLASALEEAPPPQAGPLAEALGCIGDDRATRPLVEALKRGVPRAADALGMLADVRAIPALAAATGRSAASDTNRDGPRRAAMAVVLIVRVQADPQKALSGIVLPPDAEPTAVSALGRIGPAILPAIDALARGSEGETRAAALAVTRELGGAAAKDPAAMIADLKSTDEKVRAAAASALGECDDPRAGTALLAALRDESERVRGAVIESLARRGEATAVPALIRIAREAKETSASASKAIDALGRIGTKEAADFLAELAGRKDTPLASAALAALARCREPATFDAVASCLGNASTFQRARLYRALAEIDGRRAAPILLEAITSSDRTAVSAALAALPAAGKHAVEPLLAALARGDEPTRAAVLRVLGTLGDARAVPAVAKAMSDAAEPVRQAARQAIVRFTDPAAVPALRQMLAEPASGQTAEAITALAAIGDPAAVDALQGALGHEDASVRAAALRALVRIGTPAAMSVVAACADISSLFPPRGREEADALRACDRGRLVDLLLKALDGQRADAAREAARWLGEFGGPRCVGALARAAANPELREEAAMALIALGEPVGVRFLSDSEDRSRSFDAAAVCRRPAGRDRVAQFMLALAADDARPALQPSAVRALGLLKAAEAMELLSRIVLEDEPAGTSAGATRAAAATALGQIGGSAAVAALCEALRWADPATAVAAAEALGGLGDASATAPLVQRAGDSSPEVRKAAVLALARLGAKEGLAVASAEAFQWPADMLAAMLGAAQDPHAVAALGQLSEEGALPMAALARRTLAGDRGALLAALRSCLRTGIEHRRIAAATVLSYVSDAAALKALDAAAKDDPAENVRRAAARAVARARGQ